MCKLRRDINQLCNLVKLFHRSIFPADLSGDKLVAVTTLWQSHLYTITSTRQPRLRPTNRPSNKVHKPVKTTQVVAAHYKNNIKSKYTALGQPGSSHTVSKACPPCFAWSQGGAAQSIPLFNLFYSFSCVLQAALKCTHNLKAKYAEKMKRLPVRKLTYGYQLTGGCSFFTIKSTVVISNQL